MKEDYLWDKTGKDAEIEGLENALQVFRYRETTAPELSAKVLPFRKQTSRKMFPFVMAAAACLLFAAFGLVIWLQFSSNKTIVGENLAESTVQEIDNIFHVNKTAENPFESVVEKIQYSKPASEGKAFKIRQIVPTNVRRKETKTKVFKNTKPDVRLTREEEYAYNQLMLALSITSSKLKMVKDKVEGLEE